MSLVVMAMALMDIMCKNRYLQGSNDCIFGRMNPTNIMANFNSPNSIKSPNLLNQADLVAFSGKFSAITIPISAN